MSNFLSVDSLDFQTIKENLRNHLRNQDQFKDYDFDAPNISVLLDILAYNTYMNAFYLNMVGSEMFLDSSLLRDTVVSHAKELNYLPRSYVSSSAKLNIGVNVTDDTVLNVTIPRFTRFSSSTSNGTFSFLTNDDITVYRNSSNGLFFANVFVFEGVPLTEKFIVRNSNTNQRYVLSNKKVDISSLQVKVQSSNSSAYNLYTRANSLFDLNPSSNVYFIQAAEKEKYEIIFGDNIFGRNVSSGNIITVTYRITVGPDANGSDNFQTQETIDGYTMTVSTIDVASGGSENETIESIKFNAPRHFSTQERAVTTRDYKSLLKNQFSDIKNVNVFGGEEYSDSPKYGQIFVVVNTNSGKTLTESEKETIENFLLERSSLSLQPILIDPDYLYIIVNSDVEYNISSSSKTKGQIKTIVLNTLEDYSEDYLNDFNKTLKYSRLTRAIDNSDESILNNQTSILLYKIFYPELNKKQTFSIDFNNAIKMDDVLKSNPIDNIPSFYTSTFTFNGKKVYLAEDGGGNILLYEILAEGRKVVLSRMGTIDYDNGIIRISDLVVTQTDDSDIKFFAIPRNQNIFSLKNDIITIDVSRSKINVTAIRE